MYKIYNLDKYFLFKINYVFLKFELKFDKSLKLNMYILIKF